GAVEIQHAQQINGALIPGFAPGGLQQGPEGQLPRLVKQPDGGVGVAYVYRQNHSRPLPFCAFELIISNGIWPVKRKAGSQVAARRRLSINPPAKGFGGKDSVKGNRQGSLSRWIKQ